MNPVLMLTHNCLEQTKRTIQSALLHNTVVYVIDNGSTDGTPEWIAEHSLLLKAFPDNNGVSAGWNYGLIALFADWDHVLVINNDVLLPSWFYRELLSYDVRFVTGVSVDSLQAITKPAPREPLQGAPDFSAFLIRREAWEKIGPFDEGMKFYAQDADYHIRACQSGVPLLKANVPFYHERSSTLRMASEEEQREIQARANMDREYFRKKWGFAVGSPDHYRAVGFECSPTAPKVLFPGLHGG